MSAKEATTLTAVRNAAFASGLPLADRADFERCQHGLIATSEARQISRGSGGVAWDFDRYAFMDGDTPPTVNPSLWRQGQLNTANGLFKVTDGIYQVRGFDIANITFVEGKTGWVVIDPLTCAETARAALELANLTLGERPVRAVIYPHSHVDHSGPKGQVDVGLGKAVAIGQVGLMAPTDLIRDTGETRDLDGVRIEFRNTPNAEAPAEMMFYFPEHKPLCAAENCTAVMHNLYTPRGVQVRDSLAWSKYIGETIGG